MIAIAITGDGEILWQVGYWKVREEAVDWLARNEVQIDDLIKDFSETHIELEIEVVYMNDRKKLQKMGWNR